MDSAKVVVATVEMVAMAVMVATEVTAVGHQLVAQETADTNLTLGLSVVQRLLEELGHGRLKSRNLTASHFAAGHW